MCVMLLAWLRLTAKAFDSDLAAVKLLVQTVT